MNAAKLSLLEAVGPRLPRTREPPSRPSFGEESTAMGASHEALPSRPAVGDWDWSAQAAEWVELWADLAQPAREEVAESTAIATGMHVLDIGCGTGEFCRLAASRGAAVSGIDGADGMIEIARKLSSGIDLRVGSMERLPWPADSFDVVTGFNVFQFAADPVAALVEAKRVARPGGNVVICNWGRMGDRELFTVLDPLRELLASPAPDPPPPPRPAFGEPGVLEKLTARAGLEPKQASEVDVPYVAPDRATLERALMVDVGHLGADERAGRKAVQRVIDGAAARFRQPDGSYRFENKFRYVITLA
jgi:SAM-dependent methyltransferase